MLRRGSGSSPAWRSPMRAPCIRRCRWRMPIRRPTAACSRPSPTGATATRRWSGSIRRTGSMLDITGCAHLFGGEAALARDLRLRLRAPGLSGARRGRRHRRLRLGRGALRQVRRSCRAARRSAALLPLPVAALRIDAEIVAALAHHRPQARRRRRRRGRARRSPRASARRFCAASTRRSAARTSRSRRACRCRPPWPSSAFAEPIALEADVLGTIEHLAHELGARAGAARRGRAPDRRWRCSAPTARCTASRSAPARRCATPRASARCSRSGSPRSATPAIRASATTWCGSPRSSTERCDPVQTGLAGADHARGAGASDRPARRALRPAPRDAARAAGHAYSGIRGRRRAGARGPRVPSAAHRSCRAQDTLAADAPDPPVRAAGADRGDRRGAGRPAGALPLAARAA